MPDLTVPQVAAEMQVHEETVRRWLQSGRLKGYRPGGTKAGWRITREAIEQLKRGEQPDA